MSVERTHAGHQTRYELRDETGLSCILTYTADPATRRSEREAQEDRGEA